MIRLQFKKPEQPYQDFLSRGHAGYAEEGQDIVCAGVSALVINTM